MTNNRTVRVLNGTPTLMSGSAPLPAPVFCLLHDQAKREEVVSRLHRNGVQSFAIRSPMGVGASRQTDRNIAACVERIAAVARAAPDAVLMADCDFFPSEEWMVAHPDEGYITADSRMLVLGQDGAGNPRRYIRIPGPSLKDVPGRKLHGEDARMLYGRRRLSPFSELFAHGVRATVRTLLAAFTKRGLAPRVRGMFIGCYVYGEWNMYLAAPDHSRAAVRGFRRYLRSKYRTDQALQAGWGDPFVTLATAMPPREYAKTELPPFVPGNPRQADYQAAEAETMASQFQIMAHDIKALAPHYVVGGFFPGCGPSQSGWMRLLTDPKVDFLATPLAYENRGPGGGAASQSPFCDAYAARGKVWFDELDTRTLRADNTTNYCYGRARTIRESVGLLWRDAGQMLVRGHSGWWLDFGRAGQPPYSWHLDPEALGFHKRFRAIWRGVDKLDRRPLEEIKVFIPSTASRHFQILYHADYQRQTEWTMLGAPVEWEMLENLLDGCAKPGKLNVIYGAACLSRAQMKQLQARLRGCPVTVVWMNGAGLFEAGGAIDSQRADGVIPIQQEFFRLNGPLELEAEPTPEAATWLGLRGAMRLGQFDRPLTSGFVNSPKDLSVPMKRVPVQWKLIVTDPDAMPLARQVSGSSGLEVSLENQRPERVPLPPEVTDNPVLAAAKTDDGGTTHVVYNLPVLNAGFFRALARKAGCHLFTTRDDVVYASKGLVLLHAAYTGVHKLHFPTRRAPVDLIRNVRVAARNGCVTMTLKRGDTRLFTWKGGE